MAVKHIDIYCKAFKIGEQDRDSVLCEVCTAPDCQIHHIIFKSQCGTNEIENLIALCPNCHKRAHGEGELLTRYTLFEITKTRAI